jgi:hypothetical protein
VLGVFRARRPRGAQTAEPRRLAERRARSRLLPAALRQLAWAPTSTSRPSRRRRLQRGASRKGTSRDARSSCSPRSSSWSVGAPPPLAPARAPPQADLDFDQTSGFDSTEGDPGPHLEFDQSVSGERLLTRTPAAGLVSPPADGTHPTPRSPVSTSSPCGSPQLPAASTFATWSLQGRADLGRAARAGHRPGGQAPDEHELVPHGLHRAVAAGLVRGVFCGGL